MKTVEEKATEYADGMYPNTDSNDYSRTPANEWDACYDGYVAGYNEAMRWRLPEKAGCDFCRDEQGYTIGNMYVCDKCGRQVP